MAQLEQIRLQKGESRIKLQKQVGTLLWVKAGLSLVDNCKWSEQLVLLPKPAPKGELYTVCYKEQKLKNGQRSINEI